LALWAWSRRAWPNGLEVLGGVIIVFSFGIVYFFRGNLPYASLRSVAWYHAIPVIGATLVLAGWAAGMLSKVEPRPAPGAVDGPTSAGREPIQPLTWAQAGAVVLLAVALLALHRPRIIRRVSGSDPRSAQATRQRAALRGLDDLAKVARREGFGREGIRSVFGRINVPYWPPKSSGTDGLDLIDIPENGSNRDHERIRAALGELMERSGLQSRRSASSSFVPNTKS
jgi:hypothetical protein